MLQVDVYVAKVLRSSMLEIQKAVEKSDPSPARHHANWWAGYIQIHPSAPYEART